MLSANQVALGYLAASVLFILALKGLSHPQSARRGNRFGIAGMIIAVLITFAITNRIDLAIAALIIGGGVGWFVAHRVEMTQMPELVAARPTSECMAATSSGICVISTRLATSHPTMPPMASAASVRSTRRVMSSVVATAMVIPAMPKRLPRRAESGLERPFRARMNSTLATR